MTVNFKDEAEWFKKELMEKRHAIDGWKQWHRQLVGLIGLEVYERHVTKNAVRKLVEEREAMAGDRLALLDKLADVKESDAKQRQQLRRAEEVIDAARQIGSDATDLAVGRLIARCAIYDDDYQAKKGGDS